jgi:hypothetical protein
LRYSVIINCIEYLPHLPAVINALFAGALETWKHFTTEFTSGGIINGTTDC